MKEIIEKLEAVIDELKVESGEKEPFVDRVNQIKDIKYAAKQWPAIAGEFPPNWKEGYTDAELTAALDPEVGGFYLDGKHIPDMGPSFEEQASAFGLSASEFSRLIKNGVYPGADGIADPWDREKAIKKLINNRFYYERGRLEQAAAKIGMTAEEFTAISMGQLRRQLAGV